jgi:hypothetical protein
MPDIVIKPEDLEEMPEKTRELLLEYLLPKMGLYEKYGKWSTTEPKVAEPTPTLSDNPPTQIPIEAAIAVLAPLGEQGIKAARILVESQRWVDEKYLVGFSRAELAERLGISEKSVNGVIGSINRRFSFRFDKTKYDRKKCRVIRFDRKTARYDFVNGELRKAFKYALSALNQVKKDGLSYEQYNYENVFFTSHYLTGGPGNRENDIFRLNPSAIDDFMGENGTVHQFDEDLDYDHNGLYGYESFSGYVLVGQKPSHTFWTNHDQDEEYYRSWLGDDGNLHSELNTGETNETHQGDENE